MSKEPNTLNQPAAKPSRSVLFGSAFLMATSAIGPGLLTQTSTFTAQGEGDDRVWTWEEQEIDLTGLQSAVEALSAEEFTGEAPGGPEEIALTLHLDCETFPQVELVFYQYDSSNCLVSLDGEVVLLAAREDVEAVVEAAAALIPAA